MHTGTEGVGKRHGLTDVEPYPAGPESRVRTKTKRGIKLHGRRPLCCCRPDPARRLRNTRVGSPPRAGPVLRCRRPRPQGGGVEGLDLGPALGCEGDMLTDRMRVEAIYPEDRVIHSIANSVSPFVLGKLHDSPEVQSAQDGVVKGGGTSDVRDADAGVVDHRNLLLGQSPRTRSARRTRTEDRAASGRRSAPCAFTFPCLPLQIQQRVVWESCRGSGLAASFADGRATGEERPYCRVSLRLCVARLSARFRGGVVLLGVALCPLFSRMRGR